MTLRVVDNEEPAEASKAKSLTTKIYRELRKDVLYCRLKPGEKVRIGMLQDRFGSSLSAVREALSRLSAEGLLVGHDQRGFTVAGVSLADLDDLFRTRGQIESIALRQAIELGDVAWEASISSAYGKMLRCHGSGDEYWLDQNWVSAHVEFHHTIIEGSRSPALIAMCDQLAERTERYRYLSTVVPSHRDGRAEHAAIFVALLGRHADQACEILKAHYETTARVLVEAVQTSQLTAGLSPETAA
jgi:DNA-binding GntR family transcriptional regulator